MTNADVRQLRAAYGLTQNQFARALGVSGQMVFFWEKGSYQPSDHQQIILHRLAAMTQDPNQFVLARDALNRAQFLRPIPEPTIAAGKAVLMTFGIGLLLFTLFGSEEMILQRRPRKKRRQKAVDDRKTSRS